MSLFTKKILSVTGIILSFAMLLGGCGGNDTNIDAGSTKVSDETQKISVAAVLGAHSNANQISINSKEIADKVYKSCYTQGKVSLVRCDGKPEVYFSSDIPEPEVKGLSESKLKQIAESYRDEILAEFNAEGNAVCEEVDTLEAIRLAGNTLASVDDGDKYLVVADSGLSTTGYLNFSELNLFESATEDIVEALKEKSAIPDLSGTKIVWLFLGQVAEPQQKLSETQKAKLEEIWSAVLTEANSESYTFLSDNTSSKPYTGLPNVSLVNAEKREINVKPLKKMVLDSSSVRFNGDLATFVNPAEAQSAIEKVARTLLDNPDNKVYVAGCTASAPGEEDFCQELSEKRAQAVVDELKKNGVPDSQMTAVGLGDQAPWHISDLDSNGKQIESKAEQNRAVWVLDTTDPEYGEQVAMCVNR